MNRIHIEHLTRDYGNGKGIFDLSLNIGSGVVFGFLGPNGAGKTTAIRHLMGFLRPQKGLCQIDGLDCQKKREEIQKRIGYIPGEINFFDDMTGTELLKFHLSYRKIHSDRTMKALLERFELDPKNKIRKMSKGTKQKLGIVAAFMHDPDLLILDEPTGGLDPVMQNRFISLLEEKKKQGKTILLSSHIFEEIEKICDRVGIIQNGKLVADDSTEALRNRHMRTYTVHLDTPEEAALFAGDFGGQRRGRDVTVVSKQGLESIFLDCYEGTRHD